jgi:hypothetical protein
MVSTRRASWSPSSPALTRPEAPRPHSAAPVAALTDDQETLELYHGHVRDGCFALWVHTADDDVAKRAIRALADSPALHIRHYGHRRQSDFCVQRPTS